MKGLSEIFKTAAGYELNRVVGFIGGIAFIVCANIFQAWDVMIKGHAFDVTAYCLSFPGGLAVAAGGTAAAVALKDRNVATARVIEKTGAVPAPPLSGPPVDPQDVRKADAPQPPEEARTPYGRPEIEP